MSRLRGSAASVAQVVFILAAALTIAAPARAQSRFEVGGGVSWTGGYDAGGGDASLSRGSGTSLTLFEASSRMESAPGIVARATFFLTPRLGLEALVEYGRPQLKTTITDDLEQATGSEAVTQVSSYLFGGSVLYRFGTGRVRPFALAGAAGLRQLDEGNVTLVTGTEFHGGGGVQIRLSDRLGLRADAVASSRDKSLAFEEKRRTLPVIGASLTWRF